MAARGALSGLRGCATLVPLFCRVEAAPDPAYKNRVARTLLVACPGPRLRSAAGLLLRLLLRLRQLADDRLAPRIPFRQPGQ
ncbi:Uncharacterised protein [Klebsiella variicola]|nr:Uncharacterised protein [Klebsiella variicola]